LSPIFYVITYKSLYLGWLLRIYKLQKYTRQACANELISSAYGYKLQAFSEHAVAN
jgi:hypothetical protein